MTMDSLFNILSNMRRYFNSGATRPVSFRIDQLKKLKAAIRSHEDEIIEALKTDMGKPSFESYASEIGILYTEIEYSIRHVKSWSGRRRVSTPIIHFLSASAIYQEPYGVILIIGIMLVISTGYIDYLMDHHITFSIIYLFPIALVSWFHKRIPALMITFLSAATYMAINTHDVIFMPIPWSMTTRNKWEDNRSYNLSLKIVLTGSN